MVGYRDARVLFVLVCAVRGCHGIVPRMHFNFDAQLLGSIRFSCIHDDNGLCGTTKEQAEEC